MQVRDHTKPVKEYKGGHWTFAVDAVCPCRPCYNAHDCTPPNPAYSKTAYSDVFHCASNWNSGCPQPKPEPQHILNRLNNCKRCRVHVPTHKEVIGTINRVAEEKNVKIE